MIDNKSLKAWSWIPFLYFAEGLPYVLAMSVSVILYKRLGISNTDIALYTSWLYLPWVIKPLWSPLVDMLKSKRTWILSMQFIIAVLLAAIAFTIPSSSFFQITLAIFWLLAFASATHDIAADGFYMLALTPHEQSLFVGVRTLFYRIANIAGQGLLVILAGSLETSFNDLSFAWSVVFMIISGIFFILFVYQMFILPKPTVELISDDSISAHTKNNFIEPFAEFFQKKNIFLIISFILVYRLGESQLVKLASPFLLDKQIVGGLGLSTTEVGFVYGTAGIISLTVGGLLGGVAVARNGLKHWLWWMLIAINFPDLFYVYLAYSQTSNFVLINLCVIVEQFGYGFGFTAFLMYLIYISEGKYKTSSYAIATGFMALGMMLPGMISGWIQQHLGYQLFFIWVCVSTLPAFIIARFIKIDAEFGKKNSK